MRERKKAGWKIWVAVALMLLAIGAYLATLDESETLDESLSEAEGSGERAP